MFSFVFFSQIDNIHFYCYLLNDVLFTLIQTQFVEIEKTRSSLEQQKEMERVAIENKLKAAALLREENMKKMQERLKEHVSTVAMPLYNDLIN